MKASAMSCSVLAALTLPPWVGLPRTPVLRHACADGRLPFGRHAASSWQCSLHLAQECVLRLGDLRLGFDGQLGGLQELQIHHTHEFLSKGTILAAILDGAIFSCSHFTASLQVLHQLLPPEGDCERCENWYRIFNMSHDAALANMRLGASSLMNYLYNAAKSWVGLGNVCVEGVLDTNWVFNECALKIWLSYKFCLCRYTSIGAVFSQIASLLLWSWLAVPWTANRFTSDLIRQMRCATIRIFRATSWQLTR